MSGIQSIDLTKYIRDVPDFPKPGILFKDITPLLAHPKAFSHTVDLMAEQCAELGVDIIAAAEARGFIFAGPLATRLQKGFIPIRKPGKLPYETLTHEYDLEYGSDKLQIHIDGIEKGQNVLLVDDLLATGGTMAACCKLVESAGGNVAGCAFVIELAFLGGGEKLKPYQYKTVLKY